MRHEIIISPEAHEDLAAIDATNRSAILAALEAHLRHEPAKESKSRIKRMRGLKSPEYRLRVDEFRVYYNIFSPEVHILGVIYKPLTYAWLEQHGIPQ